jgi:hypothetical protein
MAGNCEERYLLRSVVWKMYELLPNYASHPTLQSLLIVSFKKVSANSNLHNIYKFSSYLTGITIHLRSVARNSGHQTTEAVYFLLHI